MVREMRGRVLGDPVVQAHPGRELVDLMGELRSAGDPVTALVALLARIHGGRRRRAYSR